MSKKISTAWKNIKKDLLTGAIVMVPLFITVYILIALIKFVGGKAGLGHGVQSDILGIIIALVMVYVVGYLTQLTVGSRIMNWFFKVFIRIPIAGSIYSATKQIMESIMMGKSMAFQKAVIIEYPREGIYSVAFVTKEKHASPLIKGEPMLHLFVPTTPNPTSGFFLIVPEKSTIPLNMPVQEAFKLIISGGIVSNEEKTFNSGGDSNERA